MNNNGHFRLQSTCCLHDTSLSFKVSFLLESIVVSPVKMVLSSRQDGLSSSHLALVFGFKWLYLVHFRGKLSPSFSA